jgi:adenylosuccinate synthase
MPVDAVVGANWGDEGKGKVTDFLAERADLVVRFQGGRNAGHTVINGYGKFALHLLPSGVFFPHIENLLGPGVAVDADALLQELDQLVARGVPRPRIGVSDRAQLVLPIHTLFDRCEEQRLGDAKFGSTQTGIAPFYADKYLKLGVQVADLFHPLRLRARLEASLVSKNVLLRELYAEPVQTVDALLSSLARSAERLEPLVCDTTQRIREALDAGKRILVEGQLGALRDPDHGIYPYSTSSSPLAGFACVGAGIPPKAFEQIVAVAKAYSTCVGAGPFLTELEGAAAQELRDRGAADGEYGATTGRPRRVGWFDAVATRYGCRVQGATEVALSLLDVLGYLDEIPICTAYEIDGKRGVDFPVPAQLEFAKPVFEQMPGWCRDISNVRRFEDLPEQAQRYVERIEGLIDVPIRWISVGPEREAMIRRG